MDDTARQQSEPTPPPAAHAPASKPPRRVRYPGRNPRRFDQKYKEHRPDLHPDLVERVIASGKTPAGAHRPICVSEIIEILCPKPGEIALDATLGYGGHAAELLPKLLPGGKLLGLDTDPLELPRAEARLRALGFGPEALVVKRLNYAGALQFLCELGLEGVNLILADLGLSSMQIDNPERGFTFKFDAPLDMRMNPSCGEPASRFIARWTIEDWTRVLVENADEPDAPQLARHLVSCQAQSPIQTTRQLASAVRAAAGNAQSAARSEESEKRVRRVFQAVRIAVNDEFGALETFLRNLPQCLRPGGRAAILTFHSGEDRRVKKSFLHGFSSGLYSRIADEVIRPSAEEIRSNPRAAPAKLRWAIRSPLDQSSVDRPV